MKCSASPTTFTAAEPPADAAAQARRVAEAVLFREVLKPLSAALGPVGEIVTGTVADRLFALPPR